MLLTIDIGNTNITFGLYEGDELGPRWRIRTIHEKMPDEYGILMTQLFEHRGYSVADVTGIAIASVVPPLSQAFVDVSRTYLGQDPLLVDAGVRTGVHIRYDDPRQVGADRVVVAAAVRALYSVPACIVDFGTATTFDAVSAEGDYLGGAIAPGIGIAAQALFERTAKLPRVELSRPPSRYAWFNSYTIRRPCSVSQGSTTSMTRVSEATTSARPPVATTRVLAPSSARKRPTIPSTRPT